MLKRTISLLLILPLLLLFTGCTPVISAEVTDASTTEDAPETSQETTSAETTTEETLTEAPTDAPTEAPITQAPTEAPTEPPTEPPLQIVPPELVALAEIWKPLCNEYISLRTSPGGTKLIAKIPAGADLALLQWVGRYALVSYEGKQGYVLADYIQPAQENYFSENLSVIAPTDTYTYDQMLVDIQALQAKYPNRFTTDSIGKSEEGRDLPVLIVGSPQAEYHVLLQGAIHGREHFTAWLLMAIAEYSMVHNLIGDAVCYHIIPMTNPDGVAISQTGCLNQTQRDIYENDLLAGFTSLNASAYARQWKANAIGVDLNRNFPSGWEASDERPGASSEKFRGARPFTVTETQALQNYTLKHNFNATLSFHSHGSVIFYKYGTRQPVNSQSYSFAQEIGELTGYWLSEFDGTTGAGYKDWAIDELGIPSLTIEVGSTEPPLALRDIYNTFARCKDILPAVAAWLLQA